MKPKTHVYKNMRGHWTAETLLPFDGNKVLKLYTGKTSDGRITSTARVSITEAGGFIFRMFYDYGKTLISNPTRCTEKAVKEQHAQAMLMQETVLAEIAAHYAAKEDA